jgi:thymidylate synthase (FAD)
MNSVKIVTATPDVDKVIGYCARVSNPGNQGNPDVAGLLRYCARNGHWSVFEMANAVLEITTTRDIGRQILRHRSFSFQEFSQRYADATLLGEDIVLRECRMQDTKNRQNSLPCEDEMLVEAWHTMQEVVMKTAVVAYQTALENGIAKEQARALLPEGLTPSKLYVNGTLRSWITFCQVRTDASTQKEHRLLAEQAVAVLREIAPITMEAFFPKV